MKFCTNCGTQSSSMFCANCGTPIAGTGQSSAPINTPLSQPVPLVISQHAAPLGGVNTPLSAHRKTPAYVWVAGGLAAAAVIGLGLYALTARATSPFPAALESCGISSTDDYFRLSDEDNTLIIDSEGESSIGADPSDTWCVIEALNVPEAVRQRMYNTNSLAGVVRDNWDNIDASWTYHPDEGFDVVLEYSR